ncbi:ferrous iron transporter A [Ligilactobacillus salitolerans]|uniref:Ferrous iron transporter A n=1 Tax=Ligilactobacillus salitolerans TaxID=1808352 RepID=A0A401IQQ6_9LACO|nr:ferrous iron transport protein A [Ligilactobacillus salitolerans]GBG93879.1 ferrous iron transporter A [Ligilactobacillus salitolerans]
MTTLRMGQAQQKYLITKVNGDRALTVRLGELGLNKGKLVTVISEAKNGSGLVIFIQGQRLALSEAMAAQIEVILLASSQQKQAVPLSQLAVHNSAVVVRLNGDQALRKRLMDMGLTRNTLVQIYHVAPLGDPLELQVRGYKLSIRKADAAQILVQEVSL